MLKIKYFLIFVIVLSQVLLASGNRLGSLENYFNEIKRTHFIIESANVESITGMDFSHNNLCVSIDYNYIWVFNINGDIRYKFGREQYKPFTANNNVIWSNKVGEIIVSHLVRGKSFYSVYSKSGSSLLSKELHPLFINKLIRNKNTNKEAVYIGGLDIYNFKYMLQNYDTDTFFPSRKNEKIWKSYFAEAQGHWITKLNKSHEPVDSLYRVNSDMVIRKNAAYQNMFSFDIDTSHHIWVYAFPDSVFKIFDKDGKLAQENTLEVKDLKIPSIKSEREWEYYERKDGMYFDYTLHVIEPYVFLTYETEQSNLNNSSRKMSVYTTDGEFLERFDFPYKPYKYKDTLYFWVKDNNKLRLMKCTQ